MHKILTLEFIPRNPDLALLVLRVWLSATMIAIHGWFKINALISGSTRFPDIFGLGPMPTLALAALTEIVGSILIILGLWTRPAALALAITMAVAFFLAHGGRLTGQGNGELAFIFLAGYVALFLSGAGKFSVDKK